MKTANGSDRLGAGYSSASVGLASPLELAGRSLSSTRGRRSGPEPNGREKEQRQRDDSSLIEAIRLAQLGERPAFEFIYRLHCRRVHALCLRMVRDASEAEDMTQEAFLQLFRKIHTFRGESAFSTWLHRLTANTVLMHFRRKKLVSSSLDEITASDEEGEGPRIEFGAPDLRLTGLF